MILEELVRPARLERATSWFVVVDEASAPSATHRLPSEFSVRKRLRLRVSERDHFLRSVTTRGHRLLAAAVNTTVVADENLTVGSTVWLPAESLAPGR